MALSWLNRKLVGAFASTLAKGQLACYRSRRARQPYLTKEQLYTAIIAVRPTYGIETAEYLVKLASHLPQWGSAIVYPEFAQNLMNLAHEMHSPLTATFRDVVFTLIYYEYTRDGTPVGPEHYVIFRDVVDKIIPAEL